MITVATDPAGLVSFHPGTVPDGLLPVFRARTMRKAREYAETLCRHARRGGDLLVPGIPEAADQSAALDALIAFRTWISDRKGIYL